MTDKNKCLRCDYEWFSWIERPRACPRCKRYDWDIKNIIKSKEKKNGMAKKNVEKIHKKKVS